MIVEFVLYGMMVICAIFWGGLVVRMIRGHFTRKAWRKACR